MFVTLPSELFLTVRVSSNRKDESCVFIAEALFCDPFSNKILPSVVLTEHLNDGLVILRDTWSVFEISAKLILGISNSPAVAIAPLAMSCRLVISPIGSPFSHYSRCKA